MLNFVLKIKGLVLSLSLFYSIHLIGQDVIFQSTNLPLFIIETKGQSIRDEPKIEADLKIIYKGKGQLNSINDEPNAYYGKIGIEYRGNYSQRLPQKPYGFETLDSLGNEQNISLMGFPKENDWILLANYNDKAFVRNSLIFDRFRKMEHYATRAMHCEVMLNGEYQGIYVFTEKIKRDKNRVNIPKLDIDDNSGDSLTGGYIFKIDYSDGNDYWISAYHPLGYNNKSVRFIYTYPEPDEISPQQHNYLKNYVDQFENVLFGKDFSSKENGYHQYIDVPSFIDYFIIGELTRNVDAYKKSCYYYKQVDSKGGLIYAGPVWDFDWAMKNFGECFCGNTDGSGWAYQIFDCNPNPVPPEWMVRLVSDPYFKNKIYDRYFQLRESFLSEASIFAYIDSVSTELASAQVRHYQQWPILGENVGTREIDYIPTTFHGEIEKLKNWFELRLHWLDVNMLGEPSIDDETAMNAHFVQVFPNPVRDRITLKSEKEIQSVDIYNGYGQLYKSFSCSSNNFTANTSALVPGIYLLKIKSVKNKIDVIRILKN